MKYTNITYSSVNKILINGKKNLLRPIGTLILKRYMTLKLGMIPVRPDWKKHKGAKVHLLKIIIFIIII